MMPDLGKYAGTVLAAYGSTIVLLAGLVLLTLRRGRKARAEMDAVEKRERRDG